MAARRCVPTLTFHRRGRWLIEGAGELQRIDSPYANILQCSSRYQKRSVLSLVNAFLEGRCGPKAKRERGYGWY